MSYRTFGWKLMFAQCKSIFSQTTKGKIILEWKNLVCLYSVSSDSFQPCGMYAARLLCPWDFLGKNTGMGCHFLLQGIFLTQGIFRIGRWILYHCASWEARATCRCPLNIRCRLIVCTEEDTESPGGGSVKMRDLKLIIRK